MLKEDLEKAIINANICLKDWKRNKNHLYNLTDIHSLVNGWIIRILVRNNNQSYYHRKRLSKSIAKNLFFDVDVARACITALRLNIDYTVLPYLDFEELNRKANDEYSKSSLPISLDEFNIDSIKQISFI